MKITLLSTNFEMWTKRITFSTLFLDQGEIREEFADGKTLDGRRLRRWANGIRVPQTIFGRRRGQKRLEASVQDRFQRLPRLGGVSTRSFIGSQNVQHEIRRWPGFFSANAGRIRIFEPEEGFDADVHQRRRKNEDGIEFVRR